MPDNPVIAPDTRRLAFTVDEFCKTVFRMSRTSFYQDVTAGLIHVFRRGKRTYVTVDQARAYVRRLAELAPGVGEAPVKRAKAPAKGANPGPQVQRKPRKTKPSEAPTPALSNDRPISSSVEGTDSALAGDRRFGLRRLKM